MKKRSSARTTYKKRIRSKSYSHYRRTKKPTMSSAEPMTAVEAWEFNSHGYKVGGTIENIVSEIIKISIKPPVSDTKQKIINSIECLSSGNCDNVVYCEGGEYDNTCGGTGICIDLGCMKTCTQVRNGLYNCRFNTLF